MSPSVGFIGGGRITRVLLEGWRRAGSLPRDLIVSDPDADALQRLSAAFPDVLAVRENNERAARQDVTFLAVHPPALKGVLGALRGYIRADTVVVSLAPKLTIDDIGRLLGGSDRVARVIPNAPSIVGAGFNPVCFSPGLPEGDRQALFALMAPLGASPEVPETDLEAYAVLTGMGPTYLWFQLYELLKIAQDFGLPPAAAAEALQGMVLGAVRTMTQSGLPPAEVMDLVPVHPLAEDEEIFKRAYRARLRAVFDKIRPAVVAV